MRLFVLLFLHARPCCFRKAPPFTFTCLNGYRTLPMPPYSRALLGREENVKIKYVAISNSAKSDKEKQAQRGMVAEFERALSRRLEQAGFKRSRRFYSVISVLTTILVFAAGYLYFFPHKLRQQVVEEVSTVASRSLEDEKIVTKAEQLSKDVVNGILNDEQTKEVASEFVKDIIISQPTRDAAADTILSLLNDPSVLSLLRQRLSEIILDILQDDATRQIVTSQVNAILHHESIQASLQNLLSDLVNTSEVKLLMAAFFKDVLSSEIVRDQGKTLGQQVTTDVITSKEIQEQAGNALWSALKYSMTPNAFRGKNGAREDQSSQTASSTDKKEDIKVDSNVNPDEDNVENAGESDDVLFYYENYEKLNRYNIDDDNINN